MESALTKACTIKIQNFEGPLDLLYHLIEKNQIDIYDIPINEITDQYMEYLFAMQQLDLEIASEFLVMAATLLHIKSKLLLPDKKEKAVEEVDPREELVLKLIEYKRFKEFSQLLKQKEKEWERVFYKLPELIDFKWDEEVLDLNSEELKRVYTKILENNSKKLNNKSPVKMAQILQSEKVSLKSKMQEVIKTLLHRTFFMFSELFSIKHKSKAEVVTGFMAVLELSKQKKVEVVQGKQFSEIFVYKKNCTLDDIADERMAAENNAS